MSDEPVTFINVFEIAREDVESFLTGWRELAGIMAAAPGFLGAQLQETVSGDTRFQLVNVARWDSERSWRDAAANPEMRAAAQRIGADPAQQAVHHNPGLYRPVVTFEG